MHSKVVGKGFTEAPDMSDFELIGFKEEKLKTTQKKEQREGKRAN
jgi:hypothetical protein